MTGTRVRGDAGGAPCLQRPQLGWSAQGAVAGGERVAASQSESSKRTPHVAVLLSSSLLAVAGLTLAAVLILVLHVVPTLDRSGDDQRADIARLGQVQLLVSGAANDQRGYLLNRNPEFLEGMQEKSRAVEVLSQQLLSASSGTHSAYLRSALANFRAFLETHEQVEALLRAGEAPEAVTVAITTGRVERKAAQVDLTRAEEALLASTGVQSDRQLGVAKLLSVALVVLSVFLAGASAALRRGARRAVEAAAARRQAEANLTREQRSVALLQSLAEAGDDLADAFLVCVQGVCDATGWEIGHGYVRDERGVLASAESWWLADAQRYRPFATATARRPTSGRRCAGNAARRRNRRSVGDPVGTRPTSR